MDTAIGTIAGPSQDAGRESRLNLFSELPVCASLVNTSLTRVAGNNVCCNHGYLYLISNGSRISFSRIDKQLHLDNQLFFE